MSVVRRQWNDKADEWAAFMRDDSSFWTRRLRTVASITFRHVTAGRSLDVGCGPGLLVRLFADAGFEAFGSDISEGMIVRATQLLSESVPNAHERLVHTPDGKVPFDISAEPFDVISAVGILEYIGDRRTFIAGLRERLRPDGYLVLTNTNSTASLFVMLALASRVIRFWLKGNWATMKNLAGTGIWSGGHVDQTMADWIYSADALDALVAELDMELVDSVDLINLPGLDRNPGGRGRTARRLARRFGWNHIGVYRRKSTAA